MVILVRSFYHSTIINSDIEIWAPLSVPYIHARLLVPLPVVGVDEPHQSPGSASGCGDVDQIPVADRSAILEPPIKGQDRRWSIPKLTCNKHQIIARALVHKKLSLSTDLELKLCFAHVSKMDCLNLHCIGACDFELLTRGLGYRALANLSTVRTLSVSSMLNYPMHTCKKPGSTTHYLVRGVRVQTSTGDTRLDMS